MLHLPKRLLNDVSDFLCGEENPADARGDERDEDRVGRLDERKREGDREEREEARCVARVAQGNRGALDLLALCHLRVAAHCIQRSRFYNGNVFENQSTPDSTTGP